MVDAANNVTKFGSINLGSDDLAGDDHKLDKNAAHLHASNRPERPKMAETWGEMFFAWPKITFCIIVNEFCERFSFYGMRTVLTLYLLNVLKYNDRDSSTFFNTFSSLCYLTPFLGAIIADGFLGKFLTIFIVSIVYAIGQIILAFVSTKSSGSNLHPWIDFLGLFVIAIGTGGIKPCVSPFGGDQFDPYQTRMISIFFSVFYFSINAGSMISTFITPIFRATPCMGQDTCYPLAFGIPAVLMIVATIAFMLGSFWYKRKPPKSNVFRDVAVVVKKAVGNKLRHGGKKAHWLDHALTSHSCEYSAACEQLKRKKRDPSACAEAKFIDDVKSLFRVLIMYIPLPIFWSLYDQQASTWTIQAVAMDSRLWGTTLMLPDQMQVLNAVLILAFIPLFQAVVYPIWSIFAKVTPLRKMVGGGLLAALSYLIAAFIQLKVNQTLPILPSGGNAYVSVFNTIENCTITANAVTYTTEGYVIPPQHALENYHKNISMFEVKKQENVTFQFSYSPDCPKLPTLKTSQTFEVTKDPVQYIHVSKRGMFLASVSTDKPKEGTGEFATSIVVDVSSNYDKDMVFCRDNKDRDSDKPCNSGKKENYYFYKQNYTNADGDKSDLALRHNYSDGGLAIVFKVKSLRPGHWRLYYMDTDAGTYKYAGFNYTRRAQGGVYVLSLTNTQDTPTVAEMMVTQDNGVSILWQIPQIVVITAAEILFSITGLEFSYTQAAPSMKSIVGACFLLTTGIGDALIVVINIIHFTDNYAVLFLAYAIFMTVVITIFAFMSVFYYTYAEYTEVEDDDNENYDSSITHEDDSSTRSTRPILDYKSKYNEQDDAWQTKL